MTAYIADLLLIAITIPPHDVEHLLDSLAKLPYPINADLKYEEWRTIVEFPAYRSWLPDVHNLLENDGLEEAKLSYSMQVPESLAVSG